MKVLTVVHSEGYHCGPFAFTIHETDFVSYQEGKYARGGYPANYPMPALQTYVSWWRPRFNNMLWGMDVYVGNKRYEWLASPRTGATRLIGGEQHDLH